MKWGKKPLKWTIEIKKLITKKNPEVKAAIQRHFNTIFVTNAQSSFPFFCIAPPHIRHSFTHERIKTKITYFIVLLKACQKRKYISWYTNYWVAFGKFVVTELFARVSCYTDRRVGVRHARATGRRAPRYEFVNPLSRSISGDCEILTVFLHNFTRCQDFSLSEFRHEVCDRGRTLRWCSCRKASVTTTSQITYFGKKFAMNLFTGIIFSIFCFLWFYPRQKFKNKRI